MKTPLPFRSATAGGYSLLTTMMLIGAAAFVLAATLTRTMTGAKLNDRNNAYIVGGAAAEAATEKVLARMMVDFVSGGEQLLSNNLDYYQTQMLPNTNENPYWANFQFSDGTGRPNRTLVFRTTTTPNPQYTLLQIQYPGLNAFCAGYRIISNVRPIGPYNFTNAVQQDVQMAEIPVFQFAIFYNGLLEFTDCAPLTVNGRVHCNTNIYVGCPSSSSTLTFSYFVTSSGVVTNPSWFGFSQGSYSASRIKYNGTPAPGWGTGEPVLTLPIGTNNTPAAVREIVNLPQPGESITNPVSSQRYFNKADLILQVSDSNLQLTFKNSMYDASSNYYCYTNGQATNTLAYTNWAKLGITNATTGWLSTNITNFYDQRENRYARLTQIDMAKFGTWMATNVECSNKWDISNPFNGIMYVIDTRTTNSNFMDCVRLTNGAAITNGPYSAALPQGISQSGLTLATPNPLYIVGNYNCPNSAYLQTTNTTRSRPCSVICDALTLLSSAWTDSSSTTAMAINATDTTVNTAIIAGNVASTGSSDTQFSGGAQNLTRLLENWSGNNLCLNTSIICLYDSVQATHQFEKPGIYYNPPSRKFQFDLNFTQATGLPPGTPQVGAMIRATWSTPPPNTTNTVNNPFTYVAR